MEAALWRECEDTRGIVRVLDSDGYQPLPPVGPSGFVLDNCPVWCDLEGYSNPALVASPLDHEYIYLGADVTSRQPHRETFHKHVRRFKRAQPNARYEESDRFAFLSALAIWLRGMPGQDVEGLMTMLNYYGYFEAGWDGYRLIGVNAYDSNWAWLNFRYCFVTPDVPYASEWMRYQFYLAHPGWVNDGGDLGDAGLAMFKRRLGPQEIRQRNSWARAGGGA